MELMKKALDKEFWREVRESDSFVSHRAELASLWEKNCNDRSIEELTYSDYKLFWDTGDRAKYESGYFLRRRALDCSAILSLVYPDEEKYLTHLQDVIFAICNEYSWCIPASQGKLDELNSVVLDLFSCETGFALSEIYTMLCDRLDPLIKERIKYEISRRIIIPFTSVEIYDWWERKNTNWTSVCTGSVACTMMLMYPHLVDSAMISRFDRAMQRYLSGLTDDGICLEGCSYWIYGFGYFTVFADMIRNFTGGEVDYFKLDKVCLVSQFIQKMLLCDGCAVSFADGKKDYSYHLGLVHYLKDQYPDCVAVYDPKYATVSFDSCARFCLHLRSFTWFKKEYYDFPSPSELEGEFYGAISEWMIKKTSSYGFAAKGGCNAEPHNHNDVGSFIFAKNGKQILADLGAGRYTRQYFAPETRYTIIENSSRGHSVPIINGQYQILGPGARATDVKYTCGNFSMNIVSAYAQEGLARIDRSFELKDDSIILTDRYAFNGKIDITERLITTIKPKITRAGRIEICDADLTYDPFICDCVINEEPTTTGSTCYMIDFTLKDGETVFSCEIK